MKNELYNIKMRDSKGGRHENGGKHISGAERIITQDKLFDTIKKLVTRAQVHSKGRADFINISIKEVKKESIAYLTSLPVTTIKVSDYIDGRKGLLHFLKIIGIESNKSKKILHMLENFPSIRGAILLDIHTLHRLEPDLNRGVRATSMDWGQDVLPILNKTLDKEGINNFHAKEALALATKIANTPGIIGELCWSDDPNYTAGYIASKKIGYIRNVSTKSPYLRRSAIRRESILSVLRLWISIP